MKKLLAIGNAYASESTWLDFALVKFCLFALGLIAGVCAPKQHKKSIILASLLVFAATYIPLMAKLVKIALRKDDCADA